MQANQATNGESAAEPRPRKAIAGFAGGPGGNAVWLDGNQPLTACAQCHGPMPVRIWLSLAECPRCGTSIRLTAAQEQQALALLRRPGSPDVEITASQGLPEAMTQPTAIGSEVQTQGMAAIVAPSGGATTILHGSDNERSRWLGQKLAALNLTAAKSRGRPAMPRWLRYRRGIAATTLSYETDSFGAALPQPPPLLASSGTLFLCGLVSAVAHLSLILLLGLWLIHKETRDSLVLAATISDRAVDDGIEQIEMPVEEEPLDEMPVDQMITPQTTTADKELVAALTKVEQPPGDILPQAELGKLPVGNLSPGQVLAGRDPAFRGQLLAQQGGTTASEAAVARALEWLEQHQSSDGSWSLNHFSSAGDCNGRCGDPGIESDTAATALALLPFLGAGQTQLRGDYIHTVARGLRALMDMQRPDGDLRGRGGGRMYAHGQATIALCEAYALTQSDNLRDPAQRAVDFIVSAQHEEGGWRYQPREPGDLSVVGWQMMALRSAQMAYLKVPEETFLKAARFLNSVQQNASVGLYGYMPGGGATPVMTAEGLLCRQYSGWRHNHPVLVRGVTWLEANHLPKANQGNMYFWYYGTQVMHHMGGQAWEKWNDALRDPLISLQAASGHDSGSWPPLGGHDGQGGRLYTTALAACTLEVYYRHLPLYRGIAASTGERSRPKTSTH